jgi:hypothetical protein
MRPHDADGLERPRSPVEVPRLGDEPFGGAPGTHDPRKSVFQGRIELLTNEASRVVGAV